MAHQDRYEEGETRNLIIQLYEESIGGDIDHTRPTPVLLRQILASRKDRSKVAYITGKLRDMERTVSQRESEAQETGFLNQKLQEELLKRNA